MVFPVVMYGCERWTIKKPEHRRIDAFELWCWRRLLRVPWTARRSNQSILKVLGVHWKDWLDLLAVQGTRKSLLQHHSSKASILQHSAFFTVQLSHPCMTTGKTVALTRRTFVGKVISLLLNILSIWVGHNFPSKEEASFNFMAAITICSDFGAPQNKV